METQESETTEGKPEEKPEEIDKKALLPSEVQEKIDSFTNDAPSSLQKTGSMELAMGDQVITSPEGFQEMLEVPQMFERYGTYIADIQINDIYTE
ncbi:MAG: hypothetical protein IJ147_05890 [Lachnospiraceae bacterium]|nr:hypothetical protein [Lachnospiraceae bacterium]